MLIVEGIDFGKYFLPSLLNSKELFPSKECVESELIGFPLLYPLNLTLKAYILLPLIEVIEEQRYLLLLLLNSP